jgi:cell division protein FtsL
MSFNLIFSKNYNKSCYQLCKRQKNNNQKIYTMLNLLITLLLSLGSTVSPNINEREAREQLKAEHNLTLEEAYLDEEYENLGY